MALSYLAKRSLSNAFTRILRDPKQLTAILFLSLNPLLVIGGAVALLTLPIPRGLMRLSQSLLPGGVAARLDGVRTTITVILLGLVFSALLNNRLIRFGQADIDLLFPTPTPSWRMLTGRMFRGHLNAFAAAFFFWGMGVAPLLRLGGATIWPVGLLGLVGLTCAFVTVDQLGAAILLRISGREGVQRLLRVLAVAQGLLIVTGLCLVGVGLLAGWQTAISALIGIWSVVTATLLLPIGLAAELLLLPIHGDPAWVWQLFGLFGLDLISAGLVLTGGGHIRELALSPLGREGDVRRALRKSWNPLALARLARNQDLAGDAPQGEVSIPGFGRGVLALTWVRLIETRRQVLRSFVASALLTLAPLAILLRDESYSLGNLVLILIFSTSLGTQAIDDLRGHLTTADIDLVLPHPRWRLALATLLGRLPIYWGSGLLLLVGVGIWQRGANWGELALLAAWYPLQISPLIGFRGALLFLFPQASVPSGDPVQFALYTAFQGIVTSGLLLFSFLPIAIAVSLAEVLPAGPMLLWGALFGTGAVLSALSLLALAWSYGRYEPREGS